MDLRVYHIGYNCNTTPPLAPRGLALRRTHLPREAYLTSKGYEARAADEEGKTEIIVFYEEALRAGSAPLGKADEDLPEKEAQELFECLNSAVTSD